MAQALNETETADLLGVSPRTVRRLTKRGQIPHVRLPGIRGPRYPVTALRGWIAEHTVNPPAKPRRRLPGAKTFAEMFPDQFPPDASGKEAK